MVNKKSVPSGTASPLLTPKILPKRLRSSLLGYFLKSTLMSLAGDSKCITISVSGTFNVSPSCGEDEASGECAIDADGKINKTANKRFLNDIN